MFNTEQKRRNRRKIVRAFVVFDKKKNDDTDGFLHFLTEDFSTRAMYPTIIDTIQKANVAANASCYPEIISI